MIKTSSVICLLIASVFFTACGGNDFPEKDNSLVPPNSQVTESAPTNVNQLTQPNVMQQPINGLPTNLNAPATIAQPQPVNTNTAGLNPAHGAPGHRCDIAVGAPLNSPTQNTGVKASQPATTPAPVAISAPVTPSEPAAIPSGDAPKLNPAHGAPFHNCSIAVGAPLN